MATKFADGFSIRESTIPWVHKFVSKRFHCHYKETTSEFGAQNTAENPAYILPTDSAGYMFHPLPFAT